MQIFSYPHFMLKLVMIYCRIMSHSLKNVNLKNFMFVKVFHALKVGELYSRRCNIRNKQEMSTCLLRTHHPTLSQQTRKAECQGAQQQFISKTLNKAKVKTK